MKRPIIPLLRRQHGISLITGIFIFLLLAGLAALIAKVVATAHTTAAEDVLGARAYQAARGGVEWGLYQVLDPDNGTALTKSNAADALNPCFASGTEVPGLGATVTVDCTAHPSDTTYYQEGSKFLRIYRITSVARLQGPGLMVERQLEVTVEKCRDSATSAPPYDC